MKLFLCEKPSQGRDIAWVLGATKYKNGYIDGDGVRVTWCFGHLLENAPTDYYRKTWWKIENLPVIPKEWKRIPKENTQGQLNIVKKLLQETSHVVIATDADREGEVIAREVLDDAKFSGTIERLWLSALDQRSIRKALREIRPGEATQGLYLAGLGRQRADWLVGMNMTQAVTSVHGNGDGILSVGRVQTPTLRLVVERDLEIESFQTKTYFSLVAKFSGGDKTVSTKFVPSKEIEVDSDGRCLNKNQLELVISKITNKSGSVSEYKETSKTQPPPLPFSLSALQKKAAGAYGFSAKKTLDLAQSLYETHKAITYPRTDTGYLPESQFGEAAQVMVALQTIDPSTAELIRLCDLSFKSPAWNDKRITAHHGIIPTHNDKVNLKSLSSDEKKIYFLVRCHYIAQFLGNYEYIHTGVTVECEKETFSATGSSPQVLGWKRAFPKEESEKSDETVPRFAEGELLACVSSDISEQQTKPPPRFNEGTLIEKMKFIGQTVSDPNLRSILKETSGIGTEATRANIIQTLIRRNYLDHVGRGATLISTPQGRALVALLPDIIKDPATTALWEQSLDEISGGKMGLDEFLVKQEEVLMTMLNGVKEQTGKKVPSGPQYECVKCGKPMRRRYRKSDGVPFWGCSGYPDCINSVPDRDGKPGAKAARLPNPNGIAYKCRCEKGTLQLINGRKGKFWGCDRFPDCKNSYSNAEDDKPIFD